MVSMSTRIKGPISIGDNFYPEALTMSSNSKDQNYSMVESWRSNYHKSVDEVFDRIQKEYGFKEGS